MRVLIRGAGDLASGDARIGLALSDASATLCGRAWTLTEWNLDRAVAAIADVVRTEGVERTRLAMEMANAWNDEICFSLASPFPPESPSRRTISFIIRNCTKRVLSVNHTAHPNSRATRM